MRAGTVQAGRVAALLLLGAAGCLPSPSRRAGLPGPVPAASSDALRFTDVTVASGIDFRQRHGGCGKAYFVEQTGAGAALFDADGDGDLDLYFPQPTWLPGCRGEPLRARLYMNDGKGHFTLNPDAGGAWCADYGIGAAAGDYDEDGRLDLWVSCYGRSHLFHNEGRGRFRDVTSSSRIERRGYSTSAAWLDYNGDGRLDLFVCGYVQFSPSTEVRCPAPDGRPDYCTPQAFSPGRSALYRNNGDGTFTDVTQAAGVGTPGGRALGVLAVDFDADGKTDLFVANDNSSNMLFHNLGNGRFGEEAMIRGVAYGGAGKAQANMGLACADFDGNGTPDVLVTTFSNEPKTLYRNDGAGNFTDVSIGAGLAGPTLLPLGFGTALLDADQDGHADLFIANGHVEQYIQQKMASLTFAQANQLLRNDGHGAFVCVPAALPPDDVRVHRGLAAGDLDGDGDLDLTVTCLDERPVVLRNDSVGGHWLTLDLRSRAGSSSVIGAKVRITADGRTQTGWVVGGGSYLSQSDYAVHFGLGRAARVEMVEITWPDGKTRTLQDLPANQRLTVRQTASE